MVSSWGHHANSIYINQDTEGAFEQHLQELFLNGQTHLHNEEFTLALHSFQEAMATILRTVHPTMPVDPNQIGKFRFPLDLHWSRYLIQTAACSSKRLLLNTPFLPLSSMTIQLSAPQVQQLLKPITDNGLKVKSFQSPVQTNVITAFEAALKKAWKQAIMLYQTALEETPVTELAIRGGLLHRLGCVKRESRISHEGARFG